MLSRQNRRSASASVRCATLPRQRYRLATTCRPSNSHKSPSVWSKMRCVHLPRPRGALLLFAVIGRSRDRAGRAAKSPRFYTIQATKNSRTAADLCGAQPPDQRGGIPPAAAHGLDFLVEAVHQAGDGEFGAVARGLFQADAQILAHQVHGETEIE